MEKLDQGHLHPLQEHLRLTGLGRESNPGLRDAWEQTLKQRAMRTAFNNYSEHLDEASTFHNVHYCLIIHCPLTVIIKYAVQKRWMQLD